jgi:hypothetical protein
MHISKQRKYLIDLFQQSKYNQLTQPVDYVADTYSMAGAVMLATALTSSRNADFLSGFTLLPAEFIDVFLGEAERTGLWRHESYVDLVRDLNDSPEDFPAVEGSLNWALELFWNAVSCIERVQLQTERLGVVLDGVERGEPTEEDEIEFSFYCDSCLRDLPCEETLTDAPAAELVWPEDSWVADEIRKGLQ